MMKAQSGSSVEDTDEKYAHLWFASLCKFHIIPDNESQQWNFDEKHVLAVLRDKLAKKTPTWKRLKIVHGLIWYRNHVRHSRTPRLEHLRSKLQEVVINDAFEQQDRTIEEATGKGQNELDILPFQPFRATNRVFQGTQGDASLCPGL